MKSNTSLVLIVMCFFGLIISLDAQSLRKFLNSIVRRKNRHNFVPRSVKNFGKNITDFGLELGLNEPSLVGETFDLGDWPYDVAAGQNAKNIYKNTGDEAGRAFLFRSLEVKTIEMPELYTKEVIEERFGGDPNNIVESINSVVDLFERDMESELAES